MKKKPTETSASAAKITSDLLLRIPREFPARVWRRNVGKAVPYVVIRHAISYLLQGKSRAAIEYLTRARLVTFGVNGEGDIDGIICIGGNGIRLGIEVKAGNDRQREEQKSFQVMMEAHGGIYLIARDVESTIEDLRKIFLTSTVSNTKETR